VIHLSADSKRIVCTKYLGFLLTVALLAACEPSARTPGQWLRGDIVEGFPQDWSFTDEIQEIFVEVTTPYFVPHSVTIWCAQVDGNLFIAARDPETKKWVGWMKNNHDVRLKIAGKLYEVATAELSDKATLAGVQSAYAEKYNLDPPASGKKSSMQIWSIVPRL
jgi:hypothetical protein